MNTRYLTTSKITDISNIFKNCGNFKTGIVKNMMGAFRGIKYINSIDVSKFGSSQVEDMSYMINYCNCLSEYNLANLIKDSKNMIYML